MMTRNLCSVLCIALLFLMGVTKKGGEGEWQFQQNDCKCNTDNCPPIDPPPDSVDCVYANQSQLCECPGQLYPVYEDPIERICGDGPNDGRMGCECKCEGANPKGSPDCQGCAAFCKTRSSVDVDGKCEEANTYQVRCEGVETEQISVPATTCSPK